MNVLNFWKDFETARAHAFQGHLPEAQEILDDLHEKCAAGRVILSGQHLNLLRMFARHYDLRHNFADPARPLAPQEQALAGDDVGLMLVPNPVAEMEDGPEMRACNATLQRDPSDTRALLSLALRCRSSNPRRARQVLARVAASDYPEAQIARAALVSWLEEKVA